MSLIQRGTSSSREKGHESDARQAPDNQAGPILLSGLHEELRLAVARFFDVMYPVGVIFGGIAVTASIIGTLCYGGVPTLFGYTLMYLLAVIMLIFRRYLPVSWLFYTMLTFIGVNTIHFLCAVGLASNGMMSLVVFCVFTGVFLGMKAGIIAVGAGALIASLIGAAICTGTIAIRPEIVNYLAAPHAWIVQIACFLLYTIPLILAVNGMQKKMVTSLQQSSLANERLRSEVSMRTAAESELRESEAKYRNIFEHAVEGIFQVTLDGEMENINPSLARMAGFDSPEEMRMCKYNMEREFWVDPADRKVVRSLLEKDGFVEGFEVRMRRKNGTSAWVAMSLRTICDEKGNPICFEGSAEDITKRKATETALHESEMKYRSVVESSLVASYIFQDGTFRFVNSRFCALCGYSYDEIVDKMGIKDLVHPDDQVMMQMNLEKRLKGEAIENEYGLRAVRRDGKVLSVKILGSYFTYNQRPAAFGTLIDITREVTLESQLRQSQKMEAVGTLAGGIAHDFNNILTALIGYGTLLQMKMDGANPLRLYADQILSASQKAANLTQSLLAFSRRQPLSLTAQNMNSLVKGSENLLKRLVTEDIVFRTDLTPEDVVVLADPTQIDQILFNLVSNARDAMPRGGTLTISTKRVELDREFIIIHGFGEPGPYALLTVKDTGVGISSEMKEKIFDPFFTTKEVGKGTGLGLSTVYGIVKQHNGYITVVSELAHGCAFHVYLPAVKTAVHETQLPSFPSRKGKETILVAEDNDHVRQLVRDILGQYGYKVIEAVDGHEAVKKFKETEGISLLVMDSVMPRKNGRDAYDEIQRLKPDIRALFMSGYTADIVLSEGLKGHHLDFIPKPLSPRDLLEKVGNILDR
ncbi:MAG TPA: PAS domain S-box protein [Syntrophorhabdaceae bacterium]|jgi:PAS domain S-box-containing protein